MSETTEKKPSSDGMADAIAALVMITIVIGAMVFWLSSHPG
ncbi:MAG: methionine synthase [Porticoccaceae bacterium]